MIYTPRENATPAERIALTEAAVCDLHTRLLGGDGQPGEIADIRREARLQRKQIEQLKSWRWAERGAAAAFLLILKFGHQIKGMLH